MIFDLDGTLVDTAPDILAYLNEMLFELGRPGLDLGEVRPMIGDGVRSLMIRAFEASGGIPDGLDIDDLFRRYLERYSAEPARVSQPYPAMVETLEALAGAGLSLGVCTNKPQLPTGRLLARLGLDRFFWCRDRRRRSPHQEAGPGPSPGRARASWTSIRHAPS